jgi:hypothetical protein
VRSLEPRPLEYVSMNIKGLVVALFAALSAGLLADNANAQTAVTVDWLTDLKFGTVAASVDGGGTVTIPSSADTRTVTGQLIDFGGTVKRGKFRITGTPRAWVVITMPSTIVIQKGTSPHTMTISNLTLSTDNPVRLNNQGTRNVFFGGTLTVTTDQRQGTYKNESFVINVDYL